MHKFTSLQFVSSNIDDTKPIMYDSETIGLYGKIRLAQFYQESFREPMLVEYPNLEKLKQILTPLTVVGHNIAYDISTIQDNTNKVAWCPKDIHDTLYLSRLCYNTKPSFKLNDCIKYALGYDPYNDSESTEQKSELQKSDWATEILSLQQVQYAAKDVYYLQLLFNELKPFIEDTNYWLDITTLKSNLIMQCNGLSLSNAKINEQYCINNTKIANIQTKTNIMINCNSYKQVREYIENDLSDDKGLALLTAQGNERAAIVRAIRKLEKQNSFLTKFKATSKNNRIYGKFSPSARSGRSTCKDQNLQQIPRSLKNCFAVESIKEVMVYSDFSQLELRCICAICKDIHMNRLFKEKVDIHLYTAQKLFNTAVPTKEERRIAKTCNFSLLYGAGTSMFKNILLTNTGILLTDAVAKNLCVTWRKLWPGIAEWQSNGYQAFEHQVRWQTPLGRKYVATRATDQMNIQVQGMGSEVAKLANYYMNKEFAQLAINNTDYAKYLTWQRNFIHDSYIFIVPNNENIYRPVCKIIANSMILAWNKVAEQVNDTIIPMPVEVKVGYNWADIEQTSDVDNMNLIYKYTLV